MHINVDQTSNYSQNLHTPPPKRRIFFLSKSSSRLRAIVACFNKQKSISASIDERGMISTPIVGKKGDDRFEILDFKKPDTRMVTGSRDCIDQKYKSVSM